jgi:hypothetical protein
VKQADWPNFWLTVECQETSVRFWDNPYLLTSITALSPIFSLALASAYAKYLSTRVDTVTGWSNDDQKIRQINEKRVVGFLSDLHTLK